jgi:serine/threonine protein kinase
MSLSTGPRLEPYEIVAAIGAGGMGKVYRARHTRLKREVAIKILPESFAADPRSPRAILTKAAAAHRLHSSTVVPSARADL